jgi:hypothetical protein
MQKRSQLEEIGNKYKRRGNMVALAVLSGKQDPSVKKINYMRKISRNGHQIIK